MDISRRTFVATGVTAMVTAYVGSRNSPCLGQTETGAEPAGEDGSKLWLRYPRIEAAALPRRFAPWTSRPTCLRWGPRDSSYGR